MFGFIFVQINIVLCVKKTLDSRLLFSIIYKVIKYIDYILNYNYIYSCIKSRVKKVINRHVR